MSPKIKTFFKNLFSSRMIIAWIALFAASVITFFVWQDSKKEVIQSAELQFNFSVKRTKLAIIERMIAYKQVLRGGVGFFTASDSVTKAEWKMYIDRLKIEENYPGILGIGYSTVVRKNELEEHVQKIRDSGFPDYNIWPEGDRELYTSIIYLEPFNWRNRRAFGYDMYSHPVRKEAMQRAIDSAKTSLSSKIILVQETKEDVQHGFLMYLPIYNHKAIPSTVKKRREEIMGFVYSPFRMHDLMKGILGGSRHSIQLKIYDGISGNKENLMYNSAVEGGEMPDDFNPVFNEIDTVVIDGQYWTLEYNSIPVFEAGIDKSKPVLVLTAGIIISILFFVVAWSLIHTRNINKKLARILESTGEGIYGIDLNGRCTFFNKSASIMTGYSPDEVIGKIIHNYIHYKKEDGTTYPIEECAIINSCINNKGCLIDSEYFVRKDGTLFPVEYSSYPIKANKEIKGAVVTFTDITERKNSYEQLENSLNEKEVLLKEIHHRVKNNLQIISSILNLQANYISEPEALEIFQESRNRVKSMALIHEKLYQSKNLSRLNLADYVDDLIKNLMKSYFIATEKIHFEKDLTEVYFGTDTAVTLGLIINELIANALKYAFPKGQEKKGECKVYIKLENLDGIIYRMVLGDNGIGMPEEFDFEKTETLGLQLVYSLVQQLNGNIELNNINGTEYIITFKVNDAV